MRLGWVKGDKLIGVLNWIGTPAVFLYFFSMIVYPWFDKGGQWSGVQDTWMDWQTLNVGVLAFISSMVAFNISKYHANQQREREFIAARAFLPEALSELVGYFEKSAELLVEAWIRATDEQDRCKTPLEHPVPSLPENYREIFSKCISLADPEVAQYLSYILMRLQVHHARINSLSRSFQPDSNTLVIKENIKSYFFRLGELQALVGRIFNYSRGLERFDDSPLSWDEFRGAYGNLYLWLDELDDLGDFTRRAIGRGDNHGWKA